MSPPNHHAARRPSQLGATHVPHTRVGLQNGLGCAAFFLSLCAPASAAAAIRVPEALLVDPRHGGIAIAAIALVILACVLRRRSHRHAISPATSGSALRAIRLDSAGIESALRERLPEEQIPGTGESPNVAQDGICTANHPSPASGPIRNEPPVLGATPRSPSGKPTPILADRPAFSLVDRVYRLDTRQVTRLLTAVFLKDGYEVSPGVEVSPDGAIDLIATKENERVAVLTRHWTSGRVGTATVEQLSAAMRLAGINKGLLFSLKGHTFEARTLALKHGIRILDKPEILQRLEDAQAAIDPGLVSCFDSTDPTAEA